MHVSSVLSFSSYKATSPIMGALPPLAQVSLFNPNYLSKVLTLIYIRIWRLAFQHTFAEDTFKPQHTSFVIVEFCLRIMKMTEPMASNMEQMNLAAVVYQLHIFTARGRQTLCHAGLHKSCTQEDRKQPGAVGSRLCSTKKLELPLVPG